MARVTVTKPDGTRVNVEESQVGPDDVVATEVVPEPIRAGLVGAARGLTFGLSDQLFNDEEKKNVQALRAANPGATEAGVVGGEIVQGLLVPEVRAAGLAGNFAIQGGLSGLGSQISEAALNNRPVNTEFLAADVLSRAATGAVLGAGATGVGKLASKAAGKAGELAASERVINAAGNIRKGVLKKTLGIDDELFKYGESEGFFASTSHEGVAAMAAEAERKAVAKATEQLDKMVEVIPDYKPLRDRWTELAIEAGPAARKEMQQIEKAFEQGLEDVRVAPKAAATPESAALFQDVPARKPGVGGRYRGVDGNLGPLGDVGGGTVAGKGQKVIQAPTPAAVAPQAAVREAPASGLPIQLTEQVFQGVPKKRIRLESLSEDLFNAKAIKQAAIDANKSFDLGGAIQNAAVPAIFGGPKAAAALVGKDVLRHAAGQRGGYLAAKALEKIQAGKVLPNVFKGFQARVEGMLATAPGLLGPFATVLGHAAQEGTEALMAAHSALAQGPQGAEYLARMGMRPESAEETRAYGQKLAMLEALEAQKQEFDVSVDRATRSFFKGDSFEGAPRDTALSTKDFERKIKSLEQTLRDPSLLAASAPQDVMHGAPSLTAEAGQQALMAAQFLVERAPKPTDLWKPESLRVPFKPGKTEVAKWNRYADAVENPRAVAVEIARGKATPEALETVKTLYPALFAEVQQKVMNQLMMLKKPLPYTKRQSLANTFGQQLLGVTPEAQLYLQSVHMAARPPPEQAPGPSQDGRQMVNSNKNLQTQTDRIANR